MFILLACVIVRMVFSDVHVLVPDSCVHVMWERKSSDSSVRGLGLEMILDYRGRPNVVAEEDRQTYRM